MQLAKPLTGFEELRTKSRTSRSAAGKINENALTMFFLQREWLSSMIMNYSAGTFTWPPAGIRRCS